MAQTEYYKKKISENPGWQFVQIYVDDGISGLSTNRREGFNQMVEDRLAGYIDLVLTKSISRFARNTVDTVTTIRKLKEKGVAVFFEKENIFTTDSKGEFLLTVMSSLAQEESRSISENVTWGKRKQAADGKVSLAYSRFLGYDKGDEKFTMVINEEQAVIVRRMFRLFLQGFSAHRIAQIFTDENVATPAGGEIWCAQTVRRIIPMETWQYVQDEMARRRELGPRANKSLNLTCFSGKIKCERCGCSFMHNKRRNKAAMSQFGEFIEYWTCGTKKKKGGRCPTRDIPQIILQRKCAEALEMDEFDETAFNERIELITVPEHGVLTFHFTDSTEKTLSWENTLKKESWTEEARQRASEYRRKNAARGKKGASCFTSKLKCAECGCNFRRQSTKVKYTEDGKVSHWRCSEHKGCGTIGIKDHILREICAGVLGQDTFDEDDFLARIDYIVVSAPAMLTFHFKDGHTETAEYEQPEVPRPPCSEKQKEHMRQLMKARWTPEEKKRMSETMKQMRKERGSEWRRK